VLRAKIVLLAARGMPNATIAARLGITADTARKWRGRFAAHGLAGLADRKRAGRPPRFTPVQVAEVKALACQLPAEQGVPLSRWSCPELAREAISRGITQAVSATTVGRWLARTRSSPGSTAPGSSSATPTSAPRPAGCWTCMQAVGTAFRSVWRVTSADLDDLLHRIDQHQQHTTAPTIPQAA
jgi:transposase